ncbi:CobW/HypB/UreG, nucleotide-binding domain protein, partial [gut metagenome]
MYQTICCVDGTTFKPYFENMRQLMLDKFSASELIVVNRADGLRSEDSQQYVHNCVRQASRVADIAYEYADGSVAYDEILDELPFNLDADVVEIGDQDFGVWYLDISQNPEKYDGKKVRFTAQVCQTPVW